MPKRRLGVALLLPPPFDGEVDALRRACDDGALGRIPCHLTLVPPVNVREDAVGVALRVLRTAAASVTNTARYLTRPAGPVLAGAARSRGQGRPAAARRAWP